MREPEVGDGLVVGVTWTTISPETPVIGRPLVAFSDVKNDPPSTELLKLAIRVSEVIPLDVSTV